jgi:hypothetical protein
MGGFGSGNRYNHSGGGTCEGMRRVDLRLMRRRGYLSPGATGSLSWSVNGEPCGSISFRNVAGGLRLIYRATDYSGEWQSIDELVQLTETAQHLGGSRHWFKCPRCSRRCLVLYGGTYFRCRRCHRLRYQSQREDALQRSLSQAQRTRRKLGGSGSLDDPFPARPKGMHLRTYRRLHKRADMEEDRVEQLEEFFLAALIARF